MRVMEKGQAAWARSAQVVKDPAEGQDVGVELASGGWPSAKVVHVSHADCGRGEER